MSLSSLFSLLKTAHFLIILCLITSSASFDSPVFLSHAITPGTGSCVDSDPKCSIWASQNECTTNAAWMMGNCRRSCQSCQGGENAWRLRTQLAQAYDQSAGPSRNYSINKVQVQSMTVTHAEVRQEDQVVSVSGQMVLTWNDSRVAWNKQEWNIAWLNFYWIPFWTPHVILQNALPGSAGTVTWRELAANYTGQVYMWLDYTFEAACGFDYSRFPADRHVCCFQIDERRYYTVRFMVADGVEQQLQESIARTAVAGWRLVDAGMKEVKYKVEILTDWHKNPFNIENTNCQLCVTVQRNAGGFAAQISGPAVAAAVVTLLAFLISSFWNQIFLLSASLVMQLLALQLLNSKLPAVDSPPNIVKFFSFNLAITIVTLVLFVLLENISRAWHGLPPPHYVGKAIGLFAKACPCLKSEINKKPVLEKTEDGLQTTSSFDEYQWSQVTLALKYLFFFLFLALYVFMMIGCLGA